MALRLQMPVRLIKNIYYSGKINMVKIFGPQGYLESSLANFEHRDEQAQMADFIFERLVENQNGLAEAGTGTGKTLAYLIPSLLFAKENNKKITVTTETKALQKQLLENDLPIVKNLLDRFYNHTFSYSLCLGSSNYPCRKRFELTVKKGLFPKKDISKINYLITLFNDKKVFTRFDVIMSNSLWSTINRDPDACNSFRCPYASRCQFQNARREWEESDILIMNHYLYFTNIASGKAYLPQTDITIFDEAHSVENIASVQLGFNLGYNQLLEIIDRFYRKKRRNNLISNITSTAVTRKCIKAINEIQQEASVFFEEVREYFKKNDFTIRLRKPLPHGGELIKKLKDLLLFLNDCEGDFEDEYLHIEFDIARSNLFQYTENLVSFVYQNYDTFVYWIERSDKDLLGDILLKGQPIDISEIMKKEIIEHFDSSIFISATLSIGEDFSFIVKRLGIENYFESIFHSSFDYQSQMVLYIEKSLADPNNKNYNKQSAEIAASIIKELNGNCLMLFTSYKSLKEIKALLQNSINHKIYSQDEFPTNEAMEKFINHDNSVLMGTHSYWQGIDLPGDLLRGVILMRLPFAVPDSPPVQAKIERITDQGLNAFYSFQLPEAAIRFKQGFGRLIRTGNDRGIVALLDSRVFSKSYGKFFLKTLPNCKSVYSFEEMKNEYRNLTN